jgi:hypothetical protein
MYVPIVWKSWESQPPGALGTSQGLYRDRFLLDLVLQPATVCAKHVRILLLRQQHAVVTHCNYEIAVVCVSSVFMISNLAASRMCLRRTKSVPHDTKLTSEVSNLPHNWKLLSWRAGHVANRKLPSPDSLTGFENRVLTRIFGRQRGVVAGERRRLHNEELYDMYSSQNIIRVIK